MRKPEGCLLALVVALGLLLLLVPGPAKTPDYTPDTASTPTPASTGWLAQAAGTVRPFGLVVAWAVTIWLCARLAGNALRGFLVPSDERALYPPSVFSLLLGRGPRPADLQEAGAQTAAATATATAGWQVSDVGHIVRYGNAGRAPALPKPEPLAALPAPAAITPEAAVAIDPETCPHTAVIGATGGGKSTIVRAIVAHLARRYACRFVICGLGGLDWGDLSSARSEAGIAQAIDAVYAEFGARMDRLFRAGLTHIGQLGEPYLVLVIEDVEDYLAHLRDLDREQARQAKVRIRTLVDMGRKPGVCLVLTAQSGTADVFDAVMRRNLRNVYLTAGVQSTAVTWGADVQLGQLQPGMAYSLTHRQVVTFPRADRPAVPLWEGYREGVPELAAGEPVPALDWPVQRPGTVPVYRPEAAPGANEAGIPVPVPQDREPDDPAVMRYIFRTWQDLGQSFKAAEKAIYGQDGGIKFYWVRKAVEWCQDQEGRL